MFAQGRREEKVILRAVIIVTLLYILIEKIIADTIKEKCLSK